jgi:hypothetical protein
MTDVRLVATNPDDGVLVPVASNASGQLAVQSPKIEKIPNDIEVEGTVFAGSVTVDPLDDTYAFKVKAGANELGGLFKETASSRLKLGDLTTNNIDLQGASGSATFTDNTSVFAGINGGSAVFYGGDSSTTDQNNAKFRLNSGGSATFEGEVVIGSRGQKWLIRESNGVAMLIEQTLRQPRIQEVRDLPRELDLVEAALNEIMGKLRMTPPAGWEVWDGSDNS